MSETVARDAQLTLSAQLLARDQGAFCDFYDAHVSYVYKLARCVADDPTWSECVTEAVFATVWRSPEVMDPTHGSTHEALGALVERLSTVAGATAVRTVPQRTRAALHALTDGQRAALDTVYFGGQSLSHAAAALGCSVIEMARDLKAALGRLKDAQLAIAHTEAAPDVA